MTAFGEETKQRVWDAVHTTPATDVRVFIRPPSGERPTASGIDGLLTAPGIVAEFFRRRALGRRAGESDAGAAHESYIRSLTPGELADIVWRQLFLDHPPASETTRTVLTTLGLFGLDVGSGDLRLLREQFEAIPADELADRALGLANLDLVLHPVPALDAETAAAPARHPAFRPVLALGELFENWRDNARKLRHAGYGLKAKVDEFAPLELRRFLAQAASALRPAALAIDWPAGHHPEDDCVGKLVREGVLPFCRDRGLPLLVAAGAGEAEAPPAPLRIERLAPLWEDNPDVRFLLFPVREDQLSPAVLAAERCRNLLACGPDLPLGVPSLLDAYTALRLETLGTAFHACHSGAETPAELAGRWAHLRWTLGKTLIRHYGELWRTGWRFGDADLAKDAKAILGGNVRTFLNI